MTLAPILNKTADEEEKHGMPFYFKDLRDNNYIIFRAYLEGLSENVMPSWASETYIGRSEPVYTYERAERDIAFTLKLFAQSKDELDMIYKKLNKLTSLCYPQYKEDDNFVVGKAANGNGQLISLKKTRMKPPLVQFRMGELFGNSTKGMLGFIKSISYTYPDESPWETGQDIRVPKYITASIGFQVIHEKPPSLETKFYGIKERAIKNTKSATSLVVGE